MRVDLSARNSKFERNDAASALRKLCVVENRDSESVLVTLRWFEAFIRNKAGGDRIALDSVESLRRFIKGRAHRIGGGE